MPCIPNTDQQTVSGWTPINLPSSPASNERASADGPSDASTAQYSIQPPIWTESHIFANPNLAVGDVMLWLAEQYGNTQIVERMKAGNPNRILNISTIGTRINRALHAKAKEQGIAYEHLRALFDQRRKTNGAVNKMQMASKLYLKGMNAKGSQMADAEEEQAGADEERSNAREGDMTAGFEDTVAWKDKSADAQDSMDLD